MILTNYLVEKEGDAKNPEGRLCFVPEPFFGITHKHTITGTIVVHNQNRISESNTQRKKHKTFLANENDNRFFVM